MLSTVARVVVSMCCCSQLVLVINAFRPFGAASSTRRHKLAFFSIRMAKSVGLAKDAGRDQSASDLRTICRCNFMARAAWAITQSASAASQSAAYGQIQTYLKIHIHAGLSDIASVYTHIPELSNNRQLLDMPGLCQRVVRGACVAMFILFAAVFARFCVFLYISLSFTFARLFFCQFD